MTATATKSQKHTRNTLAALIQERWESDLPDRVLEALRPFNGKQITSRLLDKLPGGKDEWLMFRHYGWTEIVTRNYHMSQGNHGTRLILARSESAVPLDLAFVESDNPAYFSGRRERNHARMEARNDGARLDKLAAVMNRIERLQAELAEARADFETLTGYGEIFNPDRYELERACGLRETK